MTAWKPINLPHIAKGYWISEEGKVLRLEKGRRPRVLKVGPMSGMVVLRKTDGRVTNRSPERLVRMVFGPPPVKVLSEIEA